MILVIKKEPITCFRDIERACQELDMSEESAGELTMTIFWDKKLNLLWELMLEMAMAQQEWLIGVDVLFKILTQQCEHLVFFRKKGMVCMWQGYLIQQKKKWLKDGTAKSWDEALVSYFRANKIHWLEFNGLHSRDLQYEEIVPPRSSTYGLLPMLWILQFSSLMHYMICFRPS